VNVRLPHIPKTNYFSIFREVLIIGRLGNLSIPGGMFMRVIAYIAAAILIFFGVLFIWGAFGSTPHPEWIAVGLVSVLIGFGLIWLAGRKPAISPSGNNQNVSLKIDLPASTKIEALKCNNCGGALKPENIKMVAGAPMVECPFCGTTYQLTEEPKW
jgi:hypothetical protein